MKNIPSFISEISDEMVNAAVSAFQNEKFILGESVFKFEEELNMMIDSYEVAYNPKKFLTVNKGKPVLYNN